MSEDKKTAPGIALPKVGAATVRRMKFHFMKSNFFRVIHADGVWGGLTAHKDIHVSFFSERPVLPKSTTVEISANAMKEVEKETKQGVIREVEVDVVMNLQTAKVFHEWLAGKINDAEKVEQALADGKATIVRSSSPGEDSGA